MNKTVKFDFRTFSYIFISLIIYKIVLECIYLYIIFPNFRYQYYEQSYNNLYTLKKELISWIVVLPTVFLLYRNSKKGSFSRQVWSMILLVSYVPGIVFYIYNEMPYFVLYLIYFLNFSVLIEFFPMIRFRISKKIKRLTRTAIGLILCISVIFIWINYSGFHIQLSILDVYGTRAEAAAYKMSVLLTYAYGMSHYVLPAYIIFNLYQKKYITAAVCMIVQLISFCIDGSKGTIFILLFSVTSYFFVEYTKEYTKHIPVLISMIGIAGGIEYCLCKTFTVVSLFYRRILFLPNLLNNYYYDFFTSNQADYFRQSIEILGSSPYGQISKIIGSQYMDNGTNANNGMFSDAYANLGVLGAFIMPIFLVLLLKLFDGATAKMKKKVYISCTIACALLYVSGSFLTNILTHGLALMVIVLYLFDE